MKRYMDIDELFIQLTPMIKTIDKQAFPESQIWQKGYNDGIFAAQDTIINMPAADVREVNHGKWINLPGLVPMCSVCGELSQDADEGASYCSHCGAYMVESEQE